MEFKLIKRIANGLLCFMIWLAFMSFGAAQHNISEKDRDITVRTIALYISDLYFDEDRAVEISQSILDAHAEGKFMAMGSAEELADALTGHLVKEDRHFNVRFIGRKAVEEIMSGASATHDENRSNPYTVERQTNRGVAKVEILPGNIGYIRMNRFYAIDQSSKAITAALDLIADTDAVIFDVRQNNGGPPATVQFLISHFLGADEPVLINTFISRESPHPKQMWSLPNHPAGNRPAAPLVVLTSGRTGSAAEAFAYHLQAMKRAVVIGEATGGAGNPGGAYLTDEGFSIFISTEAARNPITQTNWEGTGVIPDIKISAEEALQHARMHLYTQLNKTAKDPLRTRSVEWAKESLDADIQSISLAESDLQKYVGSFGTRATFLKDGELMLAREGANPARLRPLGNHRFRYANDERYRIVFRFNRINQLDAFDMLMLDGQSIIYASDG